VGIAATGYCTPPQPTWKIARATSSETNDANSEEESERFGVTASSVRCQIGLVRDTAGHEGC
jgi:hypothetical protein